MANRDMNRESNVGNQHKTGQQGNVGTQQGREANQQKTGQQGTMGHQGNMGQQTGGKTGQQQGNVQQQGQQGNVGQQRQGWDQFRGRLREKWGNLRDDDLNRVSKSRNDLVGHISQAGGGNRQEIERDIDRMSRETGYRFE